MKIWIAANATAVQLSDYFILTSLYGRNTADELPSIRTATHYLNYQFVSYVPTVK
jgi:hypothetical protein